jgi:hypothetical protein
VTVTEFNNEFDIEYNSIASNAAPPLDAYEKSVLLTQAQELIVRERAEEFDSSEKARRELANLIKNAVNSTPVNKPADAINSKSRFFELNDDVMYVVAERVKLRSTNVCYNNLETNLIPVRHDEYYRNIKNPFKKPDGTVSWRINYKDIDNKKIIEILSVEGSYPNEYSYRYLKYPSPIILSNLTGLSVNGISTVTECELANSIHREILDKAVQLALEQTGNPRLQTKMIVDK